MLGKGRLSMQDIMARLTAKAYMEYDQAARAHATARLLQEAVATAPKQRPGYFLCTALAPGLLTSVKGCRALCSPARVLVEAAVVKVLLRVLLVWLQTLCLLNSRSAALEIDSHCSSSGVANSLCPSLHKMSSISFLQVAPTWR